MAVPPFGLPGGVPTFVDLLGQRASSHPQAHNYTFLVSNAIQQAQLSYAEPDLHARTAAALQESLPPGERALLLYPPGLDYIAAGNIS